MPVAPCFFCGKIIAEFLRSAPPIGYQGVATSLVSNYREIVVFRPARNPGKRHNTVH
jgi:hypothetical protein